MNSNAFIYQTLSGQAIEGRYHLKEVMGMGGFGAVFRADEVVRDRILREVAVKVIAPMMDRKQQAQQLEELIASLNLDHLHLLRGFSAGEFEHFNVDFLYLVMELAEFSLQESIERGPLTTSEARRLINQVASGLDYLHKNQQVHRDLKPGNVLWVNGSWKISDFGLVRRLGASTHTQTSNPIGTVAYMPPEAFDGEISPAWDVWSLGVMVVAALRGGDLPYEFKGQTQLQKQVIMGNIRIPSLPQEFESLVRGCLQVNRNNRWTVSQILDLTYESSGGKVNVSQKPKTTSHKSQTISYKPRARRNSSVPKKTIEKIFSKPQNIHLRRIRFIVMRECSVAVLILLIVPYGGLIRDIFVHSESYIRTYGTTPDALLLTIPLFIAFVFASFFIIKYSLKLAIYLWNNA